MIDPKGGQPDAWPRITIIMPTRNAADYVATAIESVQRQRYPNLEHIVLDNRSSDSTLARIARFPGLRVISEPDRGSHDAMNKGIGLASGEILGFLNADDIYSDDLLREVGRILTDDLSIDVVVARTIVFEEDRQRRRKLLVARDHDRNEGFWLPELTFGAPGFNGRFFRRRVFERIGYFSDDYDISADRHFLLRAALAGLKARHAGGNVGLCYRSHAGSATLNPQRRQSYAIGREHIRMAEEFSRAQQANLKQLRIFRAWYVFESVKFVLRGTAAGRLSETTRVLGRLAMREPLWPLLLLRGFILRRAVRRGEIQSKGFVLPADKKPHAPS
jgi:glycosyltransferase involved in cell wall biosynthesis